MPSSQGAYGTASIGGTATRLVAARARRESTIIQNNHATQTLHIGGDSSVTTSTGMKIAAGGSLTLDGYQGDIWAIGSGAGTTANYFELY